MYVLPAEGIVPTPEDLKPYDGLQEIRFRKDGSLAIGLFLNSDKRPVLTILAHKGDMPVVVPVEPEMANAAFEEPWSYASPEGKIIIEEKLAPSMIPEAGASS